MRVVPVAFAMLLTAGQALAVPNECTRAADRTAFDTEGLKSELMVTALACKQQDKYNAFMRTYQPAVAAEEKDLTAYFKRVYGKRYHTEYDEYISNLANAQSDNSLKSGTAFCSEFQSMFDEVMSLHNASELPAYANSQDIVQPASFQACADLPVKAVRSRHHTTHKKSTS
jgi:hypothetical protein